VYHTLLHIEFLSELSNDFKKTWTDLYAECPWSNPFCSIEWLETSYSVLSPPSHYLVPVIIREKTGKIIAAGMFEQYCDTCQKTKPRMLKLLDYNIQRTPPLLAANEENFIISMTEFLKAARKRYDRVDMFKLDLLGGTLLKTAYSLSIQRIPFISSIFNTQPAVIIPKVSEGRSVVAAIRSGKTRKKIRWTMRKLEEECSPWHIEDISSESAEFHAALEKIKTIYRSSWQYKESRKIDPERPEKFLEFIQSYSLNASQKILQQASQKIDIVRIRLLYCGNTAIAFDYILEYSYRMYIIFGSILPEYRNYGPGTILLADMLEHYRPGSIIELGGGYLDYKTSWAVTCFNTMHFSIFGTSLKGRMITAKHIIMQSLQSWNTPMQQIQRTIRKIQGKLHRRLNFPKRTPGSLDYILKIPLIPEHFISQGISEANLQQIDTADINEEQCNEEQCKQLAEVRKADKPDILTALFRKRLHEGVEAIALMENDVPVAYTWTASSMTLAEDADNTRFSLGRSQIYIFDTFIDPEKRGRQLFPLLMYTVQQKYLQRGKHQFIVLIDQMNIPSLRAHMKIGGSIVGTISYRFRRRRVERFIRTKSHVFTLESSVKDSEPAICDLSQILD